MIKDFVKSYAVTHDIEELIKVAAYFGFILPLVPEVVRNFNILSVLLYMALSVPNFILLRTVYKKYNASYVRAMEFGGARFWLWGLIYGLLLSVVYSAIYSMFSFFYSGKVVFSIGFVYFFMSYSSLVSLKWVLELRNNIIGEMVE